MKTSAEITKISTALMEAQKKFPQIKKDAKGYNYNYAKLDTIINAIREPLLESGLTILQPVYSTPDGKMIVRTRLQHISGEYFEADYYPPEIENGKNVMQDAGTIITYSRRYCLSSMLGIATEDDNDAASVGAGKKRQQPKQQKEDTGNIEALREEMRDILLSGDSEGAYFSKERKESFGNKIKWSKNYDVLERAKKEMFEIIEGVKLARSADKNTKAPEEAAKDQDPDLGLF